MSQQIGYNKLKNAASVTIFTIKYHWVKSMYEQEINYEGLNGSLYRPYQYNIHDYGWHIMGTRPRNDTGRGTTQQYL